MCRGIRGVSRLNVRLIRSDRGIRSVGCIGGIRRIRYDWIRSVRVPFACEVPVAPDFLKRRRRADSNPVS